MPRSEFQKFGVRTSTISKKDLMATQMSARNDANDPIENDEASSSHVEPAGRRKFERKNISLDVSLYSDSNFYGGLTENISVGGLFVATHNIRPVGELIDLKITLPNDTEVEAHGVVRWIREYNEASDTPPGMGIQFLQVVGEELIDEFLSTRAPLFHDAD